MRDMGGNIDKLAKWAAHQDDPIKAGGMVAYLIYIAATIGQKGTKEQKSRAAMLSEKHLQDEAVLFAQAMRNYITDLEAIHKEIINNVYGGTDAQHT